MKLALIISTILITSCSSTTNSPYSTPGMYVAPGTFAGRRIITNFTPNGETKDTTNCTVIIVKCDSMLSGTVAIDSPSETLILHGYQFSSRADGVPSLYTYGVTDVSNFGVTDSSTDFYFYGNGDSMEYAGYRSIAGSFFDINCTRKK